MIPRTNPHNHKLGGVYAISDGWDFNLTSGALPTGSSIGRPKMSSINGTRTVSCFIGTKSCMGSATRLAGESSSGDCNGLAEASGERRWYRTLREWRASETGLE